MRQELANAINELNKAWGEHVTANIALAGIHYHNKRSAAEIDRNFRESCREVARCQSNVLKLIEKL